MDNQNMAVKNTAIVPGKWVLFLKDIKNMKALYVMLLIPILLLIIFHYVPIYGVVIAFKDFRAADGILGSQWVGFKHFERFFNDLFFIRVLRNTVYISLLRLIIGFPAPIIFALLLNELKNLRFKKSVQSISYLPYFLSWVSLTTIIMNIFSPTRGIINLILIKLFNIEPIEFLTSNVWFVPILIISALWQGVGYGSIVYLASISSINPELYEASEIDGAGRFKQALHITLPSITPVMVVLFILSTGSILNAGFDQIFNLLNDLVLESGEIIDTYVYKMGIVNANYSYTTAVGLFKNIVGLIFLLIANFFAKRVSDYGIW